MKIRARTDIETDPFLNIRFIEDLLGGQYDDIYIILSTLEDDPTEAWEDQGESFLLINIPKAQVLEATIDYKDHIIQHLPKLSWLSSEQLLTFVNQRWSHA